MKWSKKAAIKRMEANQELQQVYEKYPLAQVLIESAAKLERYPEYNRISCYSAYKDWLNAATTPHDSKEYWTCVGVIDDLLPPDACDLELDESSIATNDPYLPDLPPLPKKDWQYDENGELKIRTISAQELMQKKSFPEEDARFEKMRVWLERVKRVKDYSIDPPYKHAKKVADTLAILKGEKPFPVCQYIKRVEKYGKKDFPTFCRNNPLENGWCEEHQFSHEIALLGQSMNFAPIQVSENIKIGEGISEWKYFANQAAPEQVEEIRQAILRERR